MLRHVVAQPAIAEDAGRARVVRGASDLIELLFVGDIHLGRRPSRLPEQLSDFGLSSADLSPVVAWRNTVEWATENGMDAVVLAGDVVESLDDRFEAYGPLESGVSQLAESGISVLGVAGNHDVKALPRLADRIEAFALLGRGGRWERQEITGKSGEIVDLVGWSFPRVQVPDSPLGSFDLERRPGIPTLGVLHGDLGAATSVYAPLRRSELEAAQVDAWFLGHIHGPDDLDVTRPIGYLGSLVGLDAGEPGLHGPWHVSVGSGGIQGVEQVKIAPLRWEALEADTSAITQDQEAAPADALATLMDAAIETIRERIRPDLGHVRAVGCRMHMTGRSSFTEAMRGVDFEALKAEIRVRDDVHYFINKIIDQTLPTVDLKELARSSDPPGLLARKLVALEENQLDARALIDAASSELANASARALPGDLEASDIDVRESLLRAGYEALDALLEQKRSVETSP